MKYNFNFFFIFNFFFKFRIDLFLCKLFFYFSRNDIKYIISNLIVSFQQLNFLFLKIKIYFIFYVFCNSLNYFYIPIFYENDFFLIINKPFNLIIYNILDFKNLFENLIYFYDKFFLKLFRIGLLNRIDKDTSGLMIIFKKNIFYINYLNQSFKNLINKNYLIYIYGFLKIGFYKIFFKFYKKNFFDFFKKKSFTKFLVFKNFNISNRFISFIKCLILTGRTHQLRIHFNFIKKPILLDSIYNNFHKNFFLNYVSRQCIHSYYLSFFSLNYNFNFSINLFEDMFNFYKILKFLKF